MLTIAIMNYKGGVGKTTTAVTLSSAAPLVFGKSALLVDLDPQAQCAVALGVDRAPGLYNVLRRGANLYEQVVEARDGLDLLPGDRPTSAKLQDELVADPWGHLALAEVLNGVNGYHAVFLDCPPTLGRLNVAALMAADVIICPTSCNYYGLDSIAQFVHELNTARSRRGGPTAEIVAIVPTFYDSRTKVSHEAHAILAETFGDTLARFIPRATLAERIVEEGQTIWEVAPRSPVGVAYAHLAEWLYRYIRTGGCP